MIAVDGSEQSMQAIRYVSMVFPPQRTEVALLHIGDKLPELFQDLDAYPLYHSHVTHLKTWMADQQASMGRFMDEGIAVLVKAGFPRWAVSMKTQPKKNGLARDLLKASFEGYDALVLGRTGLSRIKDRFMRSLALSLVGKVKHLPVIVVGGTPVSKDLLVAFDGSRGAMKGITWVATLLGGGEGKLLLYSLIPKRGRFRGGEKPLGSAEKSQAHQENPSQLLEEQINKARSHLVQQGISDANITCECSDIASDRASHIVRAARQGGYGSVVLGRRGLISFLEEFFIGRMSSKVLRMAEDLAVWVV